jgi:SpoVK/Ycf46/Vps4 family AAA+-type ATPase
MNLTVNVLLRELEAFNGIVIFATNLAANFDPAFERRIRTHVLFELPGLEERIEIWKLQIHPTKTPLAPDVDFRRLSDRYAVSGGDIKNAVIKAAAAAAAEPGPDAGKRISQRHFETAMEEVIAAHSVMQQSVFDNLISAVSNVEVAPAVAEPVAVVDKKEPKEVPVVTIVSLALAGLAFLVSVLAIVLVYLR